MAIKQRSKSLKSRQDALSSPIIQLNVLNGKAQSKLDIPHFSNTLKACEIGALKPVDIEILQINVGKLCNQSCAHCHVDAGPDRTEIMSQETLLQCLEILREYQIPTIDITGGAPELNPHFRWFVEECAKLGTQILNRCNLTIIVSNPKFADLPEFFARHNVQVISSLPYFNRSRTDSQRGIGVFDDSVRALKMLNARGYGQEGSGLILDLVYNPSGAFLPSSQAQLQAEFRRQLKRRYDIVFNSLYAITNLPISRFLDYLIASDNYEEYMTTLVDAFNPATVEGLMCRNTLSVSWDGYIYDCDFNQMLDLKVDSPVQHISDFDPDVLMRRSIVVDQHCYGCTAGAGSSCGGALAD